MWFLSFQQLFTDLTLACQGKFYSVHKFVLSICSDYFSEMILQTSCRNPVIVLNDVKCKYLEKILDFMYNGKMFVREKDLHALIEAAKALRVKGLIVPDDTPSSGRGRTVQHQQTEEMSCPTAKRRKVRDQNDNYEGIRVSNYDIRETTPYYMSSSLNRDGHAHNVTTVPTNHPVYRNTPQMHTSNYSSSFAKPQDSSVNNSSQGYQNNTGHHVRGEERSNEAIYYTDRVSPAMSSSEHPEGEVYYVADEAAGNNGDNGARVVGGVADDRELRLRDFRKSLPEPHQRKGISKIYQGKSIEIGSRTSTFHLVSIRKAYVLYNKGGRLDKKKSSIFCFLV